MKSQNRLLAVLSAISALGVSAISCGQKGPPLPPIVRTPAAPVIRADRRGATIELGLSVPNANTDGSRPANLTRVDIFAVNGAATRLTDREIMKRGTKVASVPVKAPRDPNDVQEEGESADEAEPTVGEGLEQGSSSAIAERVTAPILESLGVTQKRRAAEPTPADGPLLGPPAATALRTYVGVGIDAHGRPGQFSKRVSVPLELAPAPPPPIAIFVEEKKIVITWKPEPASPIARDEEDRDADRSSAEPLPSTPFGPLQPAVTYNLYDATTGQRLNDKPIKENGYEDTRMDWGTNRCYIVRAVEIVARLPVESEATGPTCMKLVDTFPPAAPKGLNAVASAGAINLIWEANTEADLAGYYVLRASGADRTLERITSQPVTDASFFDMVTPGSTFTYAVEAVDKAGNVGARSNRVTETAR